MTPGPELADRIFAPIGYRMVPLEKEKAPTDADQLAEDIRAALKKHTGAA